MPSRARAAHRGDPSSRVTAVVLVAAGLALGGCVAPLGEVPGIVGPETYPPAMVLATGAEGEDCGTSVLFVPLRRARLEDAVARAIASVPDATLLMEVRVERWTFITGVYDRSCVRVHGSAAKLVSQLVMPMPAEHEMHQSHHP